DASGAAAPAPLPGPAGRAGEKRSDASGDVAAPVGALPRRLLHPLPSERSTTPDHEDCTTDEEYQKAPVADTATPRTRTSEGQDAGRQALSPAAAATRPSPWPVSQALPPETKRSGGNDTELPTTQLQLSKPASPARPSGQRRSSRLDASQDSGKDGSSGGPSDPTSAPPAPAP
ncbi:unnamed protein product, partial [Ectocarpus sp. 12 AP-2014]